MAIASQHLSAEALIAQFALEAHPEGGHYRETYRASLQVATARGSRPASTAILSCWPPGSVPPGTGSTPTKPGTITPAGRC